MTLNRTAPPAPLLCLLLAACGDGPAPTAPPPAPEVALERVHVQYLPCRDPCGVTMTYEARSGETDEPVATTLDLSGDGSFPRRVRTTLPEGRVRFTWEYPRPSRGSATYRLRICPPVGACETVVSTVGVPDG